MSFRKKIIVLLLFLIGLSSLSAYYLTFLSLNSHIQNDIKKHENIVLLFSASWCSACKTLKPELDSALDESTGFKFYRIGSSLNKLERKILFEKYNVTGIPTLILFKKGKETNRLLGVHTKDELLQAFSSLI